jgi:hypothetical protein
MRISLGDFGRQIDQNDENDPTDDKNNDCLAPRVLLNERYRYLFLLGWEPWCVCVCVKVSQLDFTVVTPQAALFIARL